MTSLPGGPASPAQIARNGHVAALLRAKMAQHEWTPRDFNARMGLETSHTSIYVWLNAKGAPGPVTRPKLAKLLGVPEEQLKPRKPDAARDVRERVVARGGVSGGVAQTAVAVRPVTPRPGGDPLAFRITSTGEAHIRLDVTLPMDEGAALLRLLLDMSSVIRQAA
jgi:transcriptional regulator with XRE-family HTH domain